MAQTSLHNLVCPKCGLTQSAQLYDAVNVREHPEHREALMANQLNVITCAGCGFRFRVDKPLLYHDPDRRFMIFLRPTPESRAEEAEREFRAMVERLAAAAPPAPAPEMHLVLDRIELVERIFLLEAGLDPRIIEYIKHTIYSKNLERLSPARKRLLFNAQDSDDENLVFVVQDIESRRLETVVHYRREAYRALCETFDDDAQTPQLLELFPGPWLSARRLLAASAPVEDEDGEEKEAGK